MSKQIITVNNVTLSNREFKRRSFDAYMSYVSLIEGKSTTSDTIEAMKPFCADFGLSLTAETLVNTLTVRMTSVGKSGDTKAKKILSIATFRAFILGGFKEVQAMETVYHAGKRPADSKRAPSKSAQLEAENAALKEQIAQLLAAIQPATESK